MTTAPDTSGPDAPDSPPRRARRPRRLAAVAVGVIVLVGLLAAGRWWTTPDLFQDSGASMRMAPRPVAQAAVTVGVTVPHVEEEAGRTEVTFTDTPTVELSTDTAEATVAVAVCRARPGETLIGMVSSREVDESCAEVEPIGEGVKMSQGPFDARERDYVIVTLTPTRPGRVGLAEVSLSYRTDRSELYRRGTDTIGIDVLVPAR